jgi:transposase
MKKLGVPAGAKVRIWVADEHRYGLISVVRKVWTLRGHKPVAPYQSKYQWGHLYAALEVGAENASEFLFSPTVSLEASDFFLRQLAESDETAHHIVIWDGAGFHQKPGLHPIPDRIHLLQLPAYSPELNPVEKLFDQLKDHIGNRLFQTLDDIEAAIVELLSSFWADLKNVASLIGDGWLLTQANSSALPYRPVKS